VFLEGELLVTTIEIKHHNNKIKYNYNDIFGVHWYELELVVAINEQGTIYYDRVIRLINSICSISIKPIDCYT
jgi:hypothetical protein